MSGVATVRENLLATICCNHQSVGKAAKAFIASFVASNAIEFSLSQRRFADFSR